MRTYKPLNRQVWKDPSEKYALVPIREKDKYEIMHWRNEQMYHLRQKEPLTIQDQDTYFSNVVEGLFREEKPKNILFSYLKEGKCLGYGGLVHINWEDRNAELSFIMNNELEERFFGVHWINYLTLIEQVAFEDLCLNKIFAYCYDLRPQLYEVLQECGFRKEANLRKHVKFNDGYLDVVIYSKWS